MASRRDRPGPRGLLAPPLLLLLLPPLLLAPWPAAGHGGKYSREKNEPERPPQREPAAEFRMEKLNQLWDKAQRVSGGPHLPGGVRAPGAAGVASFRPALRSRLGDALRFLSGPLRGGVGGRGGPRGVASPVGRGRGGLGAGVWVERGQPPGGALQGLPSGLGPPCALVLQSERSGTGSGSPMSCPGCCPHSVVKAGEALSLRAPGRSCDAPTSSAPPPVASPFPGAPPPSAPGVGGAHLLVCLGAPSLSHRGSAASPPPPTSALRTIGGQRPWPWGTVRE